MTYSLLLGKFEVGETPEESALGIYENTRGEWFCKVWREDYGPFWTSEAAAEHLIRIAGPDTVLMRSMWDMVRTAGWRAVFSGIGIVIVLVLVFRW